MSVTTPRASRVLTFAGAGLLVAAALAGCSSSSTAASSSTSASDSASTSASTSPSGDASSSASPSDAGSASSLPGTVASPSSTVTIPDVCSLLVVDHIKQILKADPGTSVTSEKQCRYSSGLLLGVTGASDWEAAKSSITADTSLASEALPGLGDDALTVTSGTKRLVIATGRDYVVAVQGDLTKQQGIDLAGGMLQSLDALQSN